jgi:hypothetical protein
MSSETEIILTFIFKRGGKSNLSFSDLYLALSMDLNWFTPEDAKAFVNKAIDNKLLKKEGSMIQPLFDYNNINIPVGFTPSKHVFEEKVIEKSEREIETLLDKIIRHLIEQTQLSSQQIKEKIINISKTKKVTLEVAAALLAKKYDILLEAFYGEIENNIFRENNA